MPIQVFGSTMITSPTEKGVVLFGGLTSSGSENSNSLMELSGNSKETLKWIVLEQKLQYPRAFHSTFSIPNQIAINLCAKMQRRSQLRKMILSDRRSRKK